MKKILEEEYSVNAILYYLTQEELRDYIIEFLEKKNIEFEHLPDGGIYRFNNNKKPVFSAHMDMIREENVNKNLLVDLELKQLYRNGGTLGADDKAGINIILNLIEKFGSDVNFAITYDEEKGLKGSSKLIKNDDFLQKLKQASYVCVLDRKNPNDLVSTDNQYCEKDLFDYINSLTGNFFKVGKGTSCDHNNFKKYVAGVNMSVGYDKQHTNDELLNLEQYKTINDLVLSKLNVETDVKFEIPKEKVINYRRDYNYGYSYGSYSRCDSCYMSVKEVELGSMSICKSCYEEAKIQILLESYDEGLIELDFNALIGYDFQLEFDSFEEMTDFIFELDETVQEEIAEKFNKKLLSSSKLYLDMNKLTISNAKKYKKLNYKLGGTK